MPLTMMQMIEEIEEVVDKIGTNWECTFIRDMKKKCETLPRHYVNDNSFTRKQREMILKLYEKACKSSY